MADDGAQPENSAEVLLAKVRSGNGADSAREYLGNILWARMWRAITALANCEPELSKLLLLRSEVSVCMKLAQDMQVDMANAEQAVKKIKELFTTKPKI